MSRRAARPLLLVALLLATWLVSHAFCPGLDVVWLSLVPVFALAIPLVAGRYLGEDCLARLSATRRSSARRRDTTAPPVRRQVPRATRRRSGLALAGHLAGRAPPRAPVG